MKKLLLLLTMLFILSSMAFGVESFWCLNATQNYGSTGDKYRFNYSTVFNLETYFSGTPKISDYAGQSNQNGKLNESRAIGTVGVAGCAHAITYTIDTHGGQFVSQSDPSKTRSFYVVNVPDYSISGSNGRSFYYVSPYTGSSSNAPSTDNASNSMTFVAPVTTGQTGTTVYSNGRTTTVNPTSIGLDLFLCMKQLTDSDLTHLSANDDYVATITVTWRCSENCAEHSGSFDMVVRGYYGTNSGQTRDTFLLIVNPATDAMTLDLKNMIKNNQSKTIANLVISTTTKEGSQDSPYDWRNHIYAFPSASADYNSPDTNGFVLTKMTNRSITIPYTLTVYNTTAGASATGQTYDGTDYFTNRNEAGFCIDLRDLSKSSTFYYSMSYDRFGTYYYAINYTGRVEIQIPSYTIPGTGNLLKDVMTDPVSYETDYTKYIGKYESNIYYHIVYLD